MWKDKSDERLSRYKMILQGSPLLYNAAAAADKALNEHSSLIDKTVRNVCNFVLAPALSSYVLWLLDDALKNGKKRIYFIARDAYFMYITAEMFCEAFELPIECRYLSCSRYSVRIPFYHLDIEEALDYICRGGIDLTIIKILSRAGLSKNEVTAVLEDLRKDASFRFDDDEFIPYYELPNIREILKKSDVFINYTIKKSEAALPLFLGYLEQEGLTDGTPSVIADSGWTGSIQKVLNNAIRYMEPEKENPALEGYYWGLYGLPENVDPEIYHCYYFSPGYNIQEKVFFSNCLFEAVFSAPHGMTIGYSCNNGYSPIYADVSEEHNFFMEENRECFTCFARELIFYVKKHSTGIQPVDQFAHSASQTDKKIIYKLLKLFMGEPDTDEAAVFGRLHFSDDVIDHRQQLLAAELSDDELRANHAFAKILAMLGIKKGCLRESAWYEASAVNNKKKVKWHLINYRAYKMLLYIRKRHVWRKMYER